MKNPPKPLVQYDKTLPYIEDRDPSRKPDKHLVKDVRNNLYKVVEGRRPSNMLLVNKLREKVDKWRDDGYPKVTPTTRELLKFWFFEDHKVNGEPFKYWFCQREAIETLIYLFEVRGYSDLREVIMDYAEDTYAENIEIIEESVTTKDGIKIKRRKLRRYYLEQEESYDQELPEEGLLRYAFKMATGSGKTYVMALIIAWSYFNRTRENNSRYPNNFLIVAPNVIVYERLAKDFEYNKIFYSLPLIPPDWKWDIKVTLRGDNSPLNPSGNLIVNNIQQLYESKKKSQTSESIMDKILGEKPQKDFFKSTERLIDRIKKLDNLMVINDEAHHVHDEDLKWHQTLMSIHESSPKGINLWLDFSATPKDQAGIYYPWIIVDYPLAQAVEDRIVKSPLIVQRIDKEDPEEDNAKKDDYIKKYEDWIDIALERWKEHDKVYSSVGRKPVLFIMVEKNEYADKIAEKIRSISKLRSDLRLENPDEEILVIHVKNRTDDETEIKVTDKDLPSLRRLVREIDEPQNKVRIVVSNMMLREGWDVQNVTLILGLRPFTSKARILPEQAVGRGLRLMKGISPDYTQTLEIMGTKAFEEFVKELEKEGVRINVVKDPPPLPIKIEHEKERLLYDIEMPLTEYRLTRNYKKIEKLDPLKIPSLYTSKKLSKHRKKLIKMEFAITGTEVSQVEIDIPEIPSGRELVSYITKEVRNKARLTGNFATLYPKVKKYILERCFGVKIKDIEDNRLKKHLSDAEVQNAIVEILEEEISRISTESKKQVIKIGSVKLSDFKPFIWRRKNLECKKTVFNLVAVYNDFEKEFAYFLDKSPDIVRFASLAGKFSVDYLSSKGRIRLYYPDFIAVQKFNKKETFWIIETKGKDDEESERKDEAIKMWCKDISRQTKQEWKYIKIYQSHFNKYKGKCKKFKDLITFIYFENLKQNLARLGQAFFTIISYPYKIFRDLLKSL